MRKLIQVAAIAVAVGLAGCATQPEIPFDKTGGEIKVIGVVTPDMPGKPTVWLASDVGQSFGLVGALVDAGMQSSRDGKMWSIMTSASYNPQTAFVSAVQKSLAAHGYTAKLVSMAKRDSGYLKQYPAANGPDKVDAYLDISFIGNGYGYMAAGIGSSTPYRPFVYVNCRLVRASDNAVLMQDTVMYDPINTGGKVVTISPDPAYTFTDFDTLQADPKNAVAGVDSSFNATAQTIAGLLK